MYLLLPLLAAIAFAIGAMVFKRAFTEGANVAHATAVNNAFLGLIFLPLLALEPHPIPWHHWYLPVLTAGAFALGHLLNVLSLRTGDVSVATPLLGSKVIFVGLLGWGLFGIQLPTGQWLAAAFATTGVVVMGVSDFHLGQRSTSTIILALGCAAAFAVTDLLIQSWGADFGVFSFLPLQFVALGVISFAMLPWLGGLRSLRAPRRAWPWIFGAAALSAVQALLITLAIAKWHDAAGVNVVYATRGLWSVLFVWGAGHWIQNRERHTAGTRTMSFRALGALLIFGAVVLAVRSSLG